MGVQGLRGDSARSASQSALFEVLPYVSDPSSKSQTIKLTTRGALGSGLAIFTRFPMISAQALPYSLSGSPAQAFAGDFFVKKAAGNIVILHPLLGEVEIWTNHVSVYGMHS